MSEPRWTTDKPTEPGWYWRRSTPDDMPLPTRIARRPQGTTLYILVRGNEPHFTYRLSDINAGEWWTVQIQEPR